MSEQELPAGPPRVAVVGGGIAGLVAALTLRAELGPAAVITVLESSPQVGGKLAVHEVGGLVLDAGAESVLARRTEAVDLMHAVGLGEDVVTPATTSASVWSRGRLHPLPAGQVMGVPGDLTSLRASGLLTRPELARLRLDRVLPPTVTRPDVSVGAYVGRRLGRAVVDRLVEPLLGGVYAGAADQLSLAATVPGLFAAVADERSLLTAAQRVREAGVGTTTPVFAGLRGGVGRLPGAVAAAAHARIRTGATVRSLTRTGAGWRLVLGSAAAPETVEADAVVLAVPAPAAARLLADLAPMAAAELAGVDYASVALVTAVFEATGGDGLPDGSGLLVPPVEGRFVKAATFSGQKWGWISAAGRDRVVIRMSVGRHGGESDLQVDDTELGARALRDLGAIVALPGTPVDTAVTRWGGALPQYAVGHLDRVTRIRADLAARTADGPSLVLAGAAYDGVGIPAVVASGRAAGRAVAAVLTRAGRETLTA